MKERMLWIDMAKGFAIILVVIAHSINAFSWAIPGEHTIITQIDQFCGGFYMGLFFMLSGFLYGKKKINNYITTENLKKFALDKLLSLGVPFLAFSVSVWLGKFIFSSFVKNTVQLRDLLLMFLNPIGYIWFLETLLCISLFVALLDLFVKNKKIIFSILLIMMIIGFQFETGIKIIDRVCFFSMSYWLGSIIADDRKRNVLDYNWLFIITAIIFIVVQFIRSGLRDYEINDYFYIGRAISSLSGAYTFMSAFYKTKYLKGRILFKMLRYIGSISLYIYLIHPVVLAPIKNVIKIFNINNTFVSLLMLVISGILSGIVFHYISGKVIFLDFLMNAKKYIMNKIVKLNE